MERINVLYCFDAKYWLMAAVSIESLLSSAANDKTHLVIYCMVAPHTPGRRQIQKIIKAHKQKVDFIWREVKDKENPYKKYIYGRWSPVIYYPFFAHRIFPDVKKMLYIDSDTMIYRNLSELYNTDVTDFVFAAVPDMAQIQNENDICGVYIKNFSEKYLDKGIYYNTGVMLMNLKQMAKNEHLVFETNIPTKFPEQDLVNAAFKGKIARLPLKYNLIPGLNVNPVFTQEEAQEALHGGHVIVHYNSARAYDFDRAPKQIYAVFAKHAESIGKTPKQFVKYDIDFMKKFTRDTFIPHVKIRQGRVIFFGIKI